MVPFGRVSPLPIVSVDEKGCFLRYDEESGASAFIPRSQMPEGAGVGSFVNALVYLDDGRVTLTAKRPRVEAGGLAALEVKGAGRFGYFLDNGIPKELFLPFSDSVSEHEIGDTVLVYCRLDHENRMCATEYFEKFFRTKAPASFHEGDRVRLFPYARTRLGVKCVADLRFTALMHSGSVPEGLRPGKKLWGIISRIRADGLTDVIPAASGPARDEAQPLQGGSPEGADRASRSKASRGVHEVSRFGAGSPDAEAVMEVLRAHGGSLSVGDGASPAEIEKTYHMSKGRFKKAAGGLLKAGLIELSKTSVRIAGGGE